MHQKLESAEVLIADVFRELHRSFDHSEAKFLVQVRGWRDFDDLLVAALHAALTLAKVSNRTRRITDDLHFDVAGVLQQFLHVHGIVAEGCLGF